MSRGPDLIVLAARAFGTEGGAVVVTGGRIEDVTSRRAALAQRGPGTRVVDAPRGLLCPGFHDAHAHLVPLGLARRELDLHGLDLAGIALAVRHAAANRPEGRWLVGRGYDPEVFRHAELTARAALDAAVQTTPVLLRSHDYHSVALNTLGLLRAGFFPPPPDVEPEQVERAPDGLPSGIVREVAAMLATTRAEDLSPEETADATAAAIPEFHRGGITALHDMSGSRPHDTLRSLDAAGRLPLEVYATVSPQDVAREELFEPGRCLHVVAMKAFLDGALGSRTAYLLEPYEGEVSHRGIEVLSFETARDFVRAAAERGLPSFLHAIGDAAVRTALDALESAPGLAHRVEHAQMIEDADLPRFARSGIAASVQPVHMALDAPLVHRHWGGRAREAFPLRRLLDSGATVAFGSDAPIETADALAGIRCAVQRRGRDGTPLTPEESVTPAEAIAAYTSGAAASLGKTCVLAEGEPANLTLLSEDIAAVPESLADASVAATVVRGEVVFEAAR
jgi:predicted amidohydrolase YtcJ